MSETRPKERRNDIGVKIGLILAGILFTAAWNSANAGAEKATINSERIAVVETYMITMSEDVREIKDILKGGIHGTR